MKYLSVIFLISLSLSLASCADNTRTGMTSDSAPPTSLPTETDLDANTQDLTALEIRYYPKGKEGDINEIKEAELSCQGEACPDLDIDPEIFKPVPEDVACTLQYGGPEVVEVIGHYQGQVIDSTFLRTNGCEINRFVGILPLLDAVGIEVREEGAVVMEENRCQRTKPTCQVDSPLGK